MSNSLEAKICVLGSQGKLAIVASLSLCTDNSLQGVGKTSLVQRFVKGTFTPTTTTSTVGASFLTKRAIDADSGTTVRLQIWDTAGQERFRSITKLYYRGASAVILVYSIIDEHSFREMGRWLEEVKQQLGEDIIIHVVGTKSDVVAMDPTLRKVPFERCIAYVADALYPSQASTPPATAGGTGIYASDSKRNSGFWGQYVGWDICQ
jgi:small GTP-binding protein